MTPGEPTDDPDGGRGHGTDGDDPQDGAEGGGGPPAGDVEAPGDGADGVDGRDDLDGSAEGDPRKQTPRRYTAVVDRHEGDLAVLVVEADGRAVDELVVDVADLPPGGRAPDSVLSVTVVDGELLDASPRPRETDRRRESARDRFARLSRRLGREDDDGGADDGGADDDNVGDAGADADDRR